MQNYGGAHFSCFWTEIFFLGKIVPKINWNVEYRSEQACIWEESSFQIQSFIN